MPFFALPIFGVTAPEPMSVTSTILSYAWTFFITSWWLWTFPIIFLAARSTFLYWRQRVYEESLKWAFMEIKIPREINKSPRSMDQLFQAVAALRNSPGDFGEKYLDGEVTKWYTFEMCTFSGEIHFYVRVVKQQRRLIEAAFFAYYPDVELSEVPDYIHGLPHNMEDVKVQNMDVWGTEMVLRRSYGYPLKTYMAYENPDEEHQFDPMSVFMENMAKAKKGEFCGIQYNLAPLGRSWGEHYESLVEELREPKFSEHAGHEVHGGPDLPPIFKAALIQRTPGVVDVLKAVESNLAKPAFKATIRFIYMAPKSIFYDSFARRAIKGSFNQYGASDLNYFEDNKAMSTKINPWTWPFVFRLARLKARKQRVLQNYLHREFEIETFMGKLLTSHILDWNFKSVQVVLNTESMASLFHPPSNLVLTAPHTQRVESKKMGAPAGLPIYGEESDLDKFR